jgi:hypothetical protein
MVDTNGIYHSEAVRQAVSGNRAAPAMKWARYEVGNRIDAGAGLSRGAVSGHSEPASGVFQALQPGNMMTTGDQNNLKERLKRMSMRTGVPFAS